MYPEAQTFLNFWGWTLTLWRKWRREDLTELRAPERESLGQEMALQPPEILFSSTSLSSVLHTSTCSLMIDRYFLLWVAV